MTLRPATRATVPASPSFGLFRPTIRTRSPAATVGGPGRSLYVGWSGRLRRCMAAGLYGQIRRDGSDRSRRRRRSPRRRARRRRGTRRRCRSARADRRSRAAPSRTTTQAITDVQRARPDRRLRSPRGSPSGSCGRSGTSRHGDAEHRRRLVPNCELRRRSALPRPSTASAGRERRRPRERGARVAAAAQHETLAPATSTIADSVSAGAKHESRRRSRSRAVAARRWGERVHAARAAPRSAIDVSLASGCRWWIA